MARDYAGEPIDERIAHFKKLENDLILSPDDEFRFHSGCPTQALLD
ncbi:MAG: hypothetical protein ACPGPF_09725 [Pontibacterium sp.]